MYSFRYDDDICNSPSSGSFQGIGRGKARASSTGSNHSSQAEVEEENIRHAAGLVAKVDTDLLGASLRSVSHTQPLAGLRTRPSDLPTHKVGIRTFAPYPIRHLFDRLSNCSRCPLLQAKNAAADLSKNAKDLKAKGQSCLTDHQC